jgi:MFS family permease
VKPVEAVVDRSRLAAILAPRTSVVAERPVGPGRFEQADGPMAEYCRTVDVEDLPDGRVRVRQTVAFRQGFPFVRWLFYPFARRYLRRVEPTNRTPWWAPPQRMDTRAASVLASLALLAVVVGYLGSLLTETATFAASEFHTSKTAQGVTFAAIRVDILLTLVLVARADRLGRRRVALAAAAAGCLASLLGALAPGLVPWAATQVLARGFATTVGVLIGIMAAEEMPAGSRAYAVGLLAMASAFGSGLVLILLPIAGVGIRAWRILYVAPLVGFVAVWAVSRHLPESRRFVARVGKRGDRATSLAGHGGRLLLLAASGFLFFLFYLPVSQFGNEFLRKERGFSAGELSIFNLVTGTPGGIGIMVGGRLADVRGRRQVGAVALAGGTATTLAMFFSHGLGLWLWAIVGTIVGAAIVPALGVYGPELFPTALRGRANGIITLSQRAGSIVGLVAAGLLSSAFGSFAPAFAVLAAGPIVVCALVLLAYPETAGQELEALNPEDATGGPAGAAAPARASPPTR